MKFVPFNFIEEKLRYDHLTKRGRQITLSSLFWYSLYTGCLRITEWQWQLLVYLHWMTDYASISLRNGVFIMINTVYWTTFCCWNFTLKKIKKIKFFESQGLMLVEGILWDFFIFTLELVPKTNLFPKYHIFVCMANSTVCNFESEYNYSWVWQSHLATTWVVHV